MHALADRRRAPVHRDELDRTLGRDPFAYAVETGRDRLEVEFEKFAASLPRCADGTLATSIVRDRPCPVCGSAESDALFAKYGFSIHACRECAFEFTRPMLDQARVQSSALGDPELSREHLAFISQPVYRACAARRFEYELQQLFAQWAGALPPRRFLEIGASTGIGLDVARDYGLEATGIEPNADAAAVARRAGHTIVEALFVAGCVQQSSFDLAMTLDVLEHVPEPVAFLAGVRDVLVPGGLVLVQVPNAGSLIAWLDGPANQIYNGLIHLNYFDAASLGRVAVRAGLEPVRTTSFLSELGKIRRFPRARIDEVISRKAPALSRGRTLHQDWINDHRLGYKLLGIYRRPAR